MRQRFFLATLALASLGGAAAGVAPHLANAPLPATVAQVAPGSPMPGTPGSPMPLPSTPGSPGPSASP